MLTNKTSDNLEGDEFHIEEVDVNSPLFEAVMKLHAAGKSRLGPFPKGAFEDHARRKMILAAVDKNETVAGYLLYRIAKSFTKYRATIVHLTRDIKFKNKGVTLLLVDALKTRTAHLLGISLSCRRDYDIDKMWKSFGFTVRHTKKGRGANGALLDCWWFDHNHKDLFTHAADESQSEAILAAIDANVFYDLICENRAHSEDSKVLEADWLHDSIKLCISKEIYSEIQRSNNEADKARCRAAAQEFYELKVDASEIRTLETELAPLFNRASVERDASDMRQVAHAIAAEVPFFVTRDGLMLTGSDFIFEKYGLRILHPTDLINQFDVLRRETEYRPVRLEGSSWRERLVVSEDVEVITNLFKNRKNERAREFESQVRHYLVKPEEWISKVVVNGERNPTIYLVRGVGTSSVLEILVLRHTEHPLAGTLLRHLVHEISRNANIQSYKIIRVTDKELSEDSISALFELGFVFDSNTWWKMAIIGIFTREELISQIRSAPIPLSLKERFVGACLISNNLETASTITRLEYLFSPIKISSQSVPSFVVSIMQNWAEHFFDIPEGAQMRWDLNEKLHLGIEGAYYCSAHNKHVTAPSRILWYVSGKGSMSVKACSHLEEIVTDTPKALYARFRHLGIFDWKDVLEAAEGKPDQPLMAFRFTRTERFARPVTLDELKAMNVPQPQNPRRVSEEQFTAIYRLGMNLLKI